MKKIILVLLLVLPVLAFAQQGGNQYLTFTLKSSATFANSQTDTIGGAYGATITSVQLQSPDWVSVVLLANDSINVAKLYIDKRAIGESAWTTHDSLSSLIGLHNTASRAVGVLRSSTVNKIGGIGEELRLRVSFHSSGNGVANAAGVLTTPRYTLQLRYK